MPFKSKAQQRFMFAAESRGDVPKGTAHRWAEHTPNMKKLPERKQNRKKTAYDLGSLVCLARLNLLKLANYEGFPSDAQQAPEAMAPEMLQALMAQQGSVADQLEAVDGDAPNSAPDASLFVDFAQQDDTEQVAEAPVSSADPHGNRTPNWSGKSSLESGDAGMRNYEMGLPRTGGV